MNAIRFGTLVSLGILAACATERERVGEAAEDVREEMGEARQEVAREVEEGREEVARAERNLADELREQERAGDPVEFNATITGYDQDTVMLRLENGETFEVNYKPQTRFRRGGDTVLVAEIPNGQAVHVIYRIVDGQRIMEEINVTGDKPMQATPPTGTDGLPAPGTGGTQ